MEEEGINNVVIKRGEGVLDMNFKTHPRVEKARKEKCMRYYIYYTLYGVKQFPYLFKGNKEELNVVLSNLIHLGAKNIYCKLA